MEICLVIGLQAFNEEVFSKLRLPERHGPQQERAGSNDQRRAGDMGS